MSRARDLELLEARLRADFPEVEEPADPIWTAPPAWKVIDCVLSLNRNYDRFVWPRVAAFGESHPELRSVAGLARLLESYPTPRAFGEAELGTRDGRRMETLRGVVLHLLGVLPQFPGATEEERLEAWARDARPGDFLGAGIRGFALAGWQYLRMLFGAQTLKPDVHLQRYVEEAVGHPVTPVQALYLLEDAGRRLGLPLRSLDVRIWERGARGGHREPGGSA